jgi:hypothetical protein
VTAARIAAALADLAALHDQLGRLATATRAGGHAPPGPRTPDLDAIDAIDEIGNSVTTWARIVLERHKRYRVATGQAQMPELAHWLALWADWLATKPWADELLADLAAQAEKGRTVLRRGDYAVIAVCGCPITGCGGTVLARVARQDDLLPMVLTCGEWLDARRRQRLGEPVGNADQELVAGPAHRWTAGDWRALARDTAQRWIRADEVATWLDVDVAEVYRLASERRWRKTRTRPVGYLASDVAGLTRAEMAEAR